MASSIDCDDIKAYLINALFTQPEEIGTQKETEVTEHPTNTENGKKDSKEKKKAELGSSKTAKMKANTHFNKIQDKNVGEDLKDKKKKPKEGLGSTNSAAPRVTDDGFKIVSEPDLLLDDSDVSDAFESDLDDADNGNDSDDGDLTHSNGRYTNDGFKIVSSIPEDDSDISDAFCEEASDENEDNESLGKHESNLKQSISSVKNISPGKENKNTTLNITTSADNLSKDLNTSGKKRKRGTKKKNKSENNEANAQPTSSTKSKKKRKKEQNLSPEDIEIIKSRYPPHVHKIVEKLGLNWADLESKKMRDKRELSKLPQPAPVPNCQVYLKKCPGTNKVLTVYDYSEKRKGVAGLPEEKLPQKKHKSDKESEISSKGKDESMTPEEEAKLKQRREMKKQHLEELRSIKRRLNAQVINKALDPATRTQNMLAKIEKLGGPKVKKPMVNYKVYLQQKKAEKLAEEEKRQNLRDIGMRDLVKKKRRPRKKRDANEVPGWGSLGGRFSREGVRVVRKGEKANLDRS